MSYTEGTCTSQFGLLEKIKQFLEDNDYTTALYAQDTTTYNNWAYSCPESSANAKRLHIYKNGIYLNFRSTYGAGLFPVSPAKHYGIGFNVGSGFDASKNWDAQPGVATIYNAPTYTMPAYTWMNSSASYRMFLWDSPFTFLVFIKFSNTFVSYIYIGEVFPKYGDWDGGKFYLGSTKHYDSDVTKTSNTACIFTYDSAFFGAINVTTAGAWPYTGWAPCGYIYGTSSPYFIPGAYGRWSMSTRSGATVGDYYSSVLQNLPSSYTSPVQLLPIQPRLKRSDSNNYVSLLGEYPHVKITAGPASVSESVFAYAGVRYILLPISYNESGYNNALLAVEYEGA